MEIYAPDFELRGADNQMHHLARYLEDFRAVGVIFLSNYCPDVQLDEDRESLYCYLKLEAIAT